MSTYISAQSSLHNANLPPKVPIALPLGAQNLWPRSESHGVSVSLPTWDSVPGIVIETPDVMEHITYSYPRFLINPGVQELLDAVLDRLRLSKETISCSIYPSPKTATRGFKWLRSLHPDFSGAIEIVNFYMPSQSNPNKYDAQWARFSAVVFPLDFWQDAMAFWRNSGAGITTRHADYCLPNFDYLESDSSNEMFRTSASRVRASGGTNIQKQFLRAAANSESVRHKISKLLISDCPGQTPVSPDDVFLYKSGMSAIYAASESLAELNPNTEVVAYGWLYGETVDVLRFSPYKAVVSLKWGIEEELDQLENMLIAGRRISALFSELPSNIKLTSPNLERIKAMSRKYGFIVACDDTVGNFVNTDILPWVDIVMTSLTKIFSGAANVTAGSITINPSSPHYERIKAVITNNYENSIFPLDLAVLEQNCQDVTQRVFKANENALALVELLKDHPLIARLNFATLASTAAFYRRHMRAPDRCGNLMSIIFHREETAKFFYEYIDVCKGSSFGTNFTVIIPFVQLACYFDQDKVAQYGVPRDIVRISVGLEDKNEIVRAFAEALDAAEKFQNGTVTNGNRHAVNGNHAVTNGKVDMQVGKAGMVVAHHEEVYDRAVKTNGHV